MAAVKSAKSSTHNIGVPPHGFSEIGKLLVPLLFFLFYTSIFSYNLFADGYQVSFHEELVAEFPPLSNDEKLAYYSYGRGTLTFYAVNGKTRTRREIKQFEQIEEWGGYNLQTTEPSAFLRPEYVVGNMNTLCTTSTEEQGR
jgi:hypothetical protein